MSLSSQSFGYVTDKANLQQPRYAQEAKRQKQETSKTKSSKTKLNLV